MINKKILLNKKTIFIALVILMVLGTIAFWYWRNAIFSKEILKLEILGLENASVGQEISYAVKYKNNGNFMLENPRLIFELPEHSLTEDSKTRFTQELDDIYPGEERVVEFRGRLLGKEEDLKTAHAWLNYTPHNLSARYESETTFTTKITSVPITLTYDVASTIETGKEVIYSINYFSSVDYPLENMSMKVNNVDGFEIKSADPSSLDNVEWKLETLAKGKGGKITIRGLATTDTGSHIALSAKLGMWRDGVFVVMKEATQDVKAIQPLLFISQQVNGNVNYSAFPGETLEYEISLRNVGSTPFQDVFMVARLQGNSFDFSTLASGDGQAKPAERMVVFDPKQIARLQELSPKEEVRLRFGVKIKGDLDLSGGNLSVKNIVEVLDVREEFITKINSNVNFWQKAYHSTFNGIENFGPIPPKVGENTSYAILWNIENDLNNLKNIRVKAILPQNVSLVDSMYPEGEASRFSFDSQSRQIIWSAGELDSGSSKSVTFQVALKPSSFQSGSAAQLIGQATIFAEDKFTNATLQKTVPLLTTILPDDDANSGGGIVQ